MIEVNALGEGCPIPVVKTKKVLEELEGVSEAIVSHTSGTATVILSAPVADDVLTRVITDNGYQVIGIS